MRLDYLRTTHPTYNAELWRKYDALYRGGEVFRQCIKEFLPKNPEEPAEVYQARLEEARYCGYAGPICAWFSAKLMTSPFAPRAKLDGEVVEPRPFYAEFREDCDGAGTDLVDFVRERFSLALVKGSAWWCVELPSDDGVQAKTLAEYEMRGLGRAYVCPLETEQVLDWKVDRRGELLWAVVYDAEQDRPTVDSSRHMVHETWRVYDRESVETFERTYDPTKPEPKPEEVNVPSTSKRKHGFRRVPLVRLGFVGTTGVRMRSGSATRVVSPSRLEGFWLMNRLADPQIAHFRRAAALDWNLTRTCYAMPVFMLKDREPPVMGAGYYIALSTGEEMQWAGPPTDHLGVMQARLDTLKDEIYRVGNQMAQGVDNNAAAVGRSGESKAADAASTEVCLQVYGAVCREPIEYTYDLIAEARGELEDWSIEGLDTFSVADAKTIIENATDASMLNIPSVTAKREIAKRTALALLPGIDQGTRDTICREIEEGVEAEESMRVENMLAGTRDGAPTMTQQPTATPGVAEAHRQAMAERPTQVDSDDVV